MNKNTQKTLVVEKFGVEFTIFPNYSNNMGWLSPTETKVKIKEVKEGVISLRYAARRVAGYGLHISSDGTVVKYDDAVVSGDPPKLELIGEPEIFLFSFVDILNKIFYLDPHESDLAFDQLVEDYWNALEHYPVAEIQYRISLLFPGLRFVELRK